MSLKTNYKDDIYEGSRRWRITKNGDGTYNITDATAYTQQGDKFGQNDVNAITTEVNRITRSVEVTLLATNWSASAPYTQTVDVSGLKATDKPRMMSAVTKSTPASTAKIWEKMAGMVKAGEALDGRASFYCLEKKPTSDFKIKLVGVSANE